MSTNGKEQETLLYLNPIIGYRHWVVHNGELHPINIFNLPLWIPNEANQAQCGWGSLFIPANHYKTVPVKSCQCGIYAYKLFDRMWSDYRMTTRLKKDTLIKGTVALWGKIIETTHGYRTQYAYPLSFSPPVDMSNNNFTKLQKKYNVYNLLDADGNIITDY